MILFFCLIFFATFINISDTKSVISGLQNVPPKIKYSESVNKQLESRVRKDPINSIDGYEWENSGLFEGDILFLGRNALVDPSTRWPNATIPFFIQESHFNESQIETILQAIHEFHTKTCLRLKPYEDSHKNWIEITGNKNGCWSSVGMMEGEGGQQLNVQTPQCVRKGVVMHELLHAAGIYHQQSAADRDDFVEIMWENIVSEKANNFKKYNSSVVTDFSLGYDYQSIMHYSSKAFSKNGNETIVAKDKSITKLGQRDGFTEKDILKINRMYDEACHEPCEKDAKDFKELDLKSWFRSLFDVQ